MTWDWKIGDPVDDSNGGSMDAQNWGHGSDDDDNRHIGRNSPDSRIEKYGKKAWDLYMDFKEAEALHYINMALDLDDRHAKNWNKKAIILEAMERYAESEECYNRSLELSPKNLVYDNKARMLYDWADQLHRESKELPNGLDMVRDASSKILKAIRALPGENSEEDLEKYLRLWESINYSMDYERRYQLDLNYLKKHDKTELFTITGMNFLKNYVKLTPGMPLRLVREPDNELDMDAIAVYGENQKIGYVANSDSTKCKMTSSASELQGLIRDDAPAEFLLHLDRYSDIQFYIGRMKK